MLKIAIVGSRKSEVNLDDYLTTEGIEIISGGAKGIDTCAKRFAEKHNLKYTEFLPEYEKYGRAAPIYRNHSIVESADLVFAFWDGESKGTKSVINYCDKIEKPLKVVMMKR